MRKRRTNLLTRLTSLALSIVMLGQMVAPGLAVMMDTPTAGNMVMVDSEGNEIVVDESWEETFPYGTFVFASSQLAAAEGQDTQVIQIYRLGGTKGRADIAITLSPAVAQLDNGTLSYSNAASIHDFVLEVEAPLPIAAYQHYGYELDAPAITPTQVKLGVVAEDSAENTTAEDGSLVYGNTVLHLDVEADHYQWQAINSRGEWEDVGSDQNVLDVENSVFETTDIRCMYTIGDETFCSLSYVLEAEYEPVEVRKLEVPEDIEFNPEQTFNTLHLSDGEFDTYEFAMTFAEGEWVKELRITPVDDDDSESVELLSMRITDCDGGELYDTANALMMSIEDNDEVQPSFFGFEVTDLVVDKAEGSAFVTVERTGALQYVATVDYATQDGTAIAGEDYLSTSGTLYFSADMAEQTIEIPLINDGEALAEDESDLYFTLSLDNPTGGGDATAIVEGQDCAVITLYNTAESETTNLATMLYTPGADDVSGDTEVADSSILAPSKGAVTAAPVDQSGELTATLDFGGNGDISALTYDMSATLSFPWSSLHNENYWDDYADLGGWDGNDYTNDAQGLAYRGWNGGSRSENYYGFYKGELDSNDNQYEEVITQTISNFDQLFTSVTAKYRGKTEENYLDQFNSTATGGLAPAQDGRSEGYVKTGSGSFSGVVRDYDVVSGDTGTFLALGIEDFDKGWDTRHAGGEVRQIAHAQRRYLTNPVRYLIHTADDDLYSQNEQTSMYQYIAPTVSIKAKNGGVYYNNKLFVGSTLSLAFPSSAWQTYSFADLEGNKPIYLTEGSGSSLRLVKTGSTSNSRNGSVQILGSNGLSFAEGASNQLSTDGTYTVNAVLDRNQKIAINVAPSVPRLEDGRTIDPDQVDETIATFWDRANPTVTYAYADTSDLKSNKVDFLQTKSSMTSLASFPTSTKSDGSANPTITSSSALTNVRVVNFGLPASDQILFNGIQYNGNQDIPIPYSMFRAETLTFTYYHSEYLSVESDMTLTITSTELYADMNGNGQLDGKLVNGVFELTAVNGVKDQLVRTIAADETEFTITDFLPVYNEKGELVQQFLKFYYNMVPRCLTVPAGASATDSAQILPAFVTAITDTDQKAALTTEQQGYRFITSGKYSTSYTTTTPNGSISHQGGTWSGDNKLMYQAIANTTETVDVPLGGDFTPIQPTYFLTKGNKTVEYTPGINTVPSDIANYTLSDVAFKRQNWAPSYRGNMLYAFQNPKPVFITDPLVGDNLPVAAHDAGTDTYDVAQINRYLGSFNALDTVTLCIREQGTMDTPTIESMFNYDYPEDTISSLADVIQSGEHRIEVDSSNFAHFRTIPDSGNLRATQAGDDNVNQAADPNQSTNSMSEFNVDLGVELPSLSWGLTDYVTLIIDGYEFGFSIGVPLFSAEKSTGTYTSSMKENNRPQAAWGSWETSNPVSANADQAKDIGHSAAGVKRLFDKGASILDSEEWDQAKAAQKDVFGDSALAKTKGVGFSIAVNVTVMFKYSPTDNTYHFSSAMLFLQFGFEFKITFRLTVCPIVYAYMVIGASLELAGGVVNEREVVEKEADALDPTKIYSKTSSEASSSQYTSGKIAVAATNLSTGQLESDWVKTPDDVASGKAVMAGDVGDAFTFCLKSDAMNLYFNGKLKVEFKERDASSWENLGYVTSTGSAPVLVMFDDKVHGTADLEVRITVLESAASFDRVVPIEKVRNETFFSGLSIAPGLFVEVGAGVGVEFLKVELFFKASLTLTMSFATRQNNAATKGSQLRDPSSSSLSVMGMAATVADAENRISALDDSEIEAFTFDSFNFRAGFGVRVVALIFNFELDAIQFGINYARPYDTKYGGTPDDGYHDNGWKFAWYALNGGETLGSYSMDGISDEGFPGVRITAPVNTFTAQQIFGPEKAQMLLDEIESLAFDPENLPTNEFQISGFSSSGDAFRLATDLNNAADYQLVTLGQDNYLLYTISTPAANSVDANTLVLSKVKNTGETVGLVHPVTGAAGGYLVVDTEAAKTGDLDFNAQASSNTIHVSWVSYASATGADGSTSAPMPDASVHPRPSYQDGETTVYMDKDNYTDSHFNTAGPEPVAPEKPKEPTDPEPVAPKVTDYYLTAEEYAALDETAKAGYDATTFHAVSYADLAAAQSAYADDQSTYEADKADWDQAQADYKTAMDEYEADYETYEADKAEWDEAMAEYLPWYNYFDSAKQTANNTADLLSQSAKNTVVKYASYTVGSESFTAPKVLTDGTGTYRFLPEISPDGKLTFFAQASNYSDEEKAEANEKAKDFYDASKGTVSTDANGLSTGEGDPSAGFRYTYTTSMNDIYGKSSNFVFTYQLDDGTTKTTSFSPNGWADEGTRLSSVTMAMAGENTFYLAYTATRAETETGSAGYADKNVHKLYLQKGTVDPATGVVTLGTAKMLRQLVDVNDKGMGEALTQSLRTMVTSEGTVTVDGVYANRGSGAVQIEAFEDPYFGSITFLTGKLGNLTGEEEDFGESLAFTPLSAENSLFLLFEMNGNTYVVPEASLNSITDETDGSGMIIPFFSRAEADGTKGGVHIGTDGEGNISAVYTDTVPYTTNNAIFVSKYDPNTTSFGEGRMLAMNNMQVYEDSINNRWSDEETEAAYLGQLPGYNNGNMTSFSFSDLTVALGLNKANNSTNTSTLLVLAKGVQTQLEQVDYLGGDGSKVISAKYDENGSMLTSTGYYALSFGVGEKNVGEGNILFASPDFIPGVGLNPTVTFKNTGDVPLLGSKAEPITVGLHLTAQDGVSADQELYEWKIEDNIAVGQVVTTEMKDGQFTTALPDDLAGRKFYFTVEEYAKVEGQVGGVDNPISYNSLTAEGGFVRTIEERPELAIENLKFSTVGATKDKVEITVEMDVTNRGTADSAAPYLQFAYQNGRTMEEVKEGDTDYQQATYAALDISDGSFQISRQTPIQTFSDDADRQQGILRLVGPDSADLKEGYVRKVTGTFFVDKDTYCDATVTGSLNLKVSVFDDGSSISSMAADGLRDSNFTNEYQAMNNVAYQSMEPQTFFTYPAKISVPLSTTMRLSLPISTTTKENPVISVSELNTQALETEEKHLGILYYNMGNSGDGSDGYLVITPSSEGSGIIRVSDLSTSSYADISFTVTKSGTGVDIFKNNDIFTWYDDSGNQFDPNTQSNDRWTFQENVVDWGPDNLVTQAPYLNNLSKANYEGVSFSFTTLAESIKLYFDGEIRVTSNFPGYEATTYSAEGGEGDKAYAVINLGSNPTNEAHTVTVTATKADTLFDRMVETFAKNQDILPDTGGAGPQIYFSRVMPETASLQSGTSLTMKVYLVDDSGLNSIQLDPGTTGATTANYTRTSDTFHEFDLTVSANGTFTLQANDISGNATSRTIRVDWFNTTVSQTDAPVSLDVDLLYRDSSGASLDLSDADQLRAGQFAYLEVDTDPGAEISVQFYQVETETTTTTYELVKESDGSWTLVKTETTTDEYGNPVGEPVVTRTPNVPADTPTTGSVQTQSKGSWVNVEPTDNTTPTYPMAQNGLYKVYSSNDVSGSTWMYRMNRLNNSLPTIFAQYDSLKQAIAYTVSKGESSATGIKSLVVNGYTLYNDAKAENATVTDTFPITYSGEYLFTVTDGAGNEQSFNVMPQLSLLGKAGWVAVSASFNQERNNGSITLDASKVMGGRYDAPTSDPANNQYVNAYQFALVPAAEQFTQAYPDVSTMTAEEARAAIAAYEAAYDAFMDGLAWQTGETFSNLAPGGYTVYAKDAADTPAASTSSDFLSQQLYVEDMAVSFEVIRTPVGTAGVNYMITVELSGGSGVYELYAIRRNGENDMLSGDEIQSIIDADPLLFWSLSTEDVFTFQNCKPAWNQIFVRDRNNPENLYTAMHRIVVTTEDDRLVQENEDDNLVIKEGNVIVLIPKGTLSPDDCVEDMIIRLPKNLQEPVEGNVIQYTSPEGETSIVPWCAFMDGRMIYLADKVGKYELVWNKVDFKDTKGHWGEGYVDFATARTLFAGTAPGIFSPDVTMTRGMFATVLARMEGVDAADYPGSSFTDVDPNAWYAPWVEWAVQEGILSGYGNGLFGPNDPITREQAIAILYGYSVIKGIDTNNRADLSVFADEDRVSYWAINSMSWAIDSGFISGRPGGFIDPAASSTRAEVSTILKNYIQYTLQHMKETEQF